MRGINFSKSPLPEVSHLTSKATVVRNATPEDAPAIARLFELAYGQSSHPCKDPQNVREGICSGGAVWRVAIDRDAVVACITLIVNAWNDSWELARAVTLPEYRGSGLGTELMQCSVDQACASPSCQVLMGFPRSRTMLHIVSSLKPSLLPVGHDGAINVANGTREYHAIVCALNPSARFRHYVPSAPSLADSEFVRDQILRRLGFHPDRAQYPPAWVVGEGIEHPDLKPFSFGYDPLCPSDAIEITGYQSDSRNPKEVARELIQMLESFYHTRHARLVVPIDKTEFIRELMAASFEITAYLPAWYLYHGARYDCVLLVRRRFQEEPTNHGIREVVDNFRDGLQQSAA